MSIARENASGAAAQRELYGSTWQERFTAIRAAYRLSQLALATTIGLSAPMVSQLSSGQRTKVGNPAVLARVTMLEEHLGDVGIRAGDPAAIAAVIAAVSGAHPVLTTQAAVSDARAAAVQWLSRHASAAQLTELADSARRVGAADVAALLSDAAGPQ